MTKQKRISVPWDDMLSENAWYRSYRENIDGVLNRYIFVLADSFGIGLTTAVISCRQIGNMHVANGEWIGYHITIKIGKEAGQELETPCVELIPVR